MQENKLVEAALTYLSKFNFSIIPVNSDKKPFIKWESYQKQRATGDEIKAWWRKWPAAMIGIVTGTLSGLVVIDVDNDEGREALEKYIPESLECPIAKTPRGGEHLYFKAPEKCPGNKAGMPKGVDFRGEGGYVVAPPSVNGTGKGYQWAEALSLEAVPLPALPEHYIVFINSLAFRGVIGGAPLHEDHTRPQETTQDHKMFIQGSRDEDLFHVANVLARGGGRPEVISQVIEKLAFSCTPAFSISEAQEKIKSALKRSEVRERNLAQEIREWVMTTQDHFKTTEGHKELHLTTPREFKTFTMVLLRMCEEGLIERDGDRRGSYKVVNTECEKIDFLNASDQIFKIQWPFQIERYVEVCPKNVIIVAGEKDAGKTAFLLNVTRLNMVQHEVFYFSSEMGDRELKKRLTKFDLPLKEWTFHPIERASNFADVIRPDALNIIDFLEVYDEFYKIGLFIKEIFNKLQKGIAVIAIQKNPKTDFGLGGMRSMEKARLYLSLEKGGHAKIVSGKNWASEVRPDGLCLDYKLVQGAAFKTQKDWYRGT